MTTYTDEINVYNPDAIQDGIDEAGTTASSYIVNAGTTGDVWVHSEGHGPNASGNATSNTYGWRIGSVFELVRAGLSYLKMWVDSSVAKVRVGLETSGHSVFSPDGMEVFTDETTSVAEFGADGARIGKEDGSRVSITAYGMVEKDSDGTEFAKFLDSRSIDWDGTGEAFCAIASDRFVVDGNTSTETYFNLSAAFWDLGLVQVLAPGSDTWVEHIDWWYIDSPIPTNATAFKLASIPEVGTRFVVVYYTKDPGMKEFTLGSRDLRASAGKLSFVAGRMCRAPGGYSQAFGKETISEGLASHSEGDSTHCIGDASHAEGHESIALGEGSHAEGLYSTSEGKYSHAEGYSSRATGDYSHAEGCEYDYDPAPVASGEGSHAEGCGTVASGGYSHAEGGFSGHGGIGRQELTIASGFVSHAEGSRVTASGNYSHAQNFGTVASSTAQTAMGKYNVEDANDTYALIIGNGEDDDHRSNALTVGWDGKVNGVDVTAIGQTATPVNATTTAASGSNTDVASIQLPAGTWIVWGKVQFPANSSGRRAVKLSTTSQEPDNVMSTLNMNATSSGTAQMSTSRCFTLASAADVYLVAWQNSGSSLACVGDIEATRVA